LFAALGCAMNKGRKKIYILNKINSDPGSFIDNKIWDKANSLKISNYLWMNNSYKPDVFAKLLYSNRYVYVYFKVYEKRVRIQYPNFGDDVYKDSCVEFFINLFPEKSDDYFNIEINAIGALLIGVGKDGDDLKRRYFKKEETDGIEIYPSIKEPISGIHGADYWTLYYRIPIRFFEDYYKEQFTSDEAIGNFYKCGDETEFEHYGAWNKVENPTPNFHLPQYFGTIIFSP
jgi:hypothetical protein